MVALEFYSLVWSSYFLPCIFSILDAVFHLTAHVLGSGLLCWIGPQKLRHASGGCALTYAGVLPGEFKLPYFETKVVTCLCTWVNILELELSFAHALTACLKQRGLVE